MHLLQLLQWAASLDHHRHCRLAVCCESFRCGLACACSVSLGAAVGNGTLLSLLKHGTCLLEDSFVGVHGLARTIHEHLMV